MQLLRYGQSFKQQTRDEFNKVPALMEVRVNFLSFGRGFERKSAFGVGLTWNDIEAAIKTFSEMGHPKAIELRNAANLAAAAKEAGWQASDEAGSN